MAADGLHCGMGARVAVPVRCKPVHRLAPSQRLTINAMTCFKLGLTGSIGMGKSTVSAMFSDCGVLVWSADETVHQLYAPGGAAVPAVAELYPTSISNGGVDRKALSALVVGDEAAMKQLEAAVHPLVAASCSSFLQQAEAKQAPLVVLDIPLLYETHAEDQVDAVAVVSAPPAVQRQRVLARPGMTSGKLDALLQRQVPDEEKRSRASYIINTDCALEDTRRQVEVLVKQLGGQAGSRVAQP